MLHFIDYSIHFLCNYIPTTLNKAINKQFAFYFTEVILLMCILSGPLLFRVTFNAKNYKHRFVVSLLIQKKKN